MKKVLSIFNIVEVMLVSTPLASHFRLFKDQLPLIEQEWIYMAEVSYVLVVLCMLLFVLDWI